jgi:hypothetical protein
MTRPSGVSAILTINPGLVEASWFFLEKIDPKTL